MFGYYLKLRSKQLMRLLAGIGPVRSLFVLLMIVGIGAVLVRIERGWVVPAVVVAGLWIYHHGRKDRAFLTQQVGQPARFLRSEYLLIGFPFLCLEAWKENLSGCAVILLAGIVLPAVKPVRWRGRSFSLPFLYKGGLEYLRLFRHYGWLYVSLLLVAVIGALHGNVRVAKAGLLVWGALQTAAFASIPRREERIHFQSEKRWVRYVCLSSLWNGTVTALPLMAVILCTSPAMSEVKFALSAGIGGFLALCNMGLFKYVCRSVVGLILYQLVVLLPLFLCACVEPLLLVLLALLNALLLLNVKHEWKRIWK